MRRSGGPEVPIRELVENKDQQLKKKRSAKVCVASLDALTSEAVTSGPVRTLRIVRTDGTFLLTRQNAKKLPRARTYHKKRNGGDDTQNLDTIGRLSSVVGNLNSVNTTYASGFGYSAANQLTGFHYGNNIYAAFGYSADRLQLNCLDYSTTNRAGTCAHDATTKFGVSFSFGSAGSNNGLLSGITDSVDAGRSTAYTYDSLYRLSTATSTGSTG